MRLVVLLLLILFWANGLWAQEHKKDTISSDTVSARYVVLRGFVVGGEKKELLPGAYICVGEKRIAVAATDDHGKFVIPKLKSGKVLLSVSYVGYEIFSGNYQIDSDIDIGEICLETKVLDEVLVEATPPLSVQRGDTTQFNTAAVKVNEDASLEDLLKKLPGFEIVDGKIMAQGKEISKLYIDGMEYSLHDPAIGLKNLPAKLFALVKMFDDQSEEAKFSGFDDGQKFRTLNLVTHHPEKMKLFGGANAGYGVTVPLNHTFKEKNYNLGFSANLFDPKNKISLSGDMDNRGQNNDLPGSYYHRKGGDNNSKSIFLNYSTRWKEKNSFSLGYRLSSGNGYSASLSKQDYFATERYETRINDQENHSWRDDQNHTVDARLQVSVNEKNTISFTPSISVSKNHSNSLNRGGNIENKDTVNVSHTENWSRGNNLRLGAYLTWMHAFAKKGRTLTLRVNGNYSNNASDQAQNNDERSLNSDNIYVDTLRNLLITNERANYSWNSSLTYSEPLTDYARVSFNYSYRVSNDYSDKASLSYKDKSFEQLIGLDSAQTNQLENSYKVQDGGINYSYSRKKITVNAGLTLSYTSMENRYSYLGDADSLLKSVYTDISPGANFSYRIKENGFLNMGYRGASSSPGTKELQDVLDVTNPLQVYKGNPHLKKSYNHNVFFTYNRSYPSKSIYWSSSMNIGQTFNQVASNVKFIQQDTVVNGYTLLRGARLTIPVNLNGNWNVNVNMDCSFPLEKLKLRFNTSLNYGFRHNPSIYDDLKNYTSSHNVGLRVNMNTNVSQKWDISLSTMSSYSYSESSTSGSAQYFREGLGTSIFWEFWKAFLCRIDYSGEFYINKKGETINQSQHIVNLTLGKKMGKKRVWELGISGNDILRESSAVIYSLYDLYAQTSYRTMASTYYMVSLTYRFNNIDKLKSGDRH